ncbi:hypothetical protein ACFZAB_34385 [Streptomyces albogriseolus]|uniref:hypothetical protein n=1 Tax=Streptomyces albogriseolus TaxID=1887 RepID=UPI00224CD555|nr:hypothetical protein [Streptomyces viridodiastaticus]MCX4618025.1 hypothetical protein [Streptomyces viridodiastaticus]
MSLARRPASELPGDPAQLRLVYSHGHPAVPYEDEDTLEHWRVSIRAYHDEEEECAGGCTEACPQLIDDGSEVGWLRLWRLRDYTGVDRWMVADAQSGDLESIASAVLHDGEYSDAFQETIDCPVGDLLILDRVFLTRPWRGFGLGPVFAAEAIRRLSGGCCAVAAEPGMAEWPENRDAVSDAYRATAKAKIAALWESIGFHAFHGGVQLLDTSLQEPIDLHHARRKDLEDLSAAYRAHLEGRPALPELAVTPPASPATPVPAATHQPPASAPEAEAEPGNGLAAAASLSDLQRKCEFSGWSPDDRAAALAVAAQATHDTDLRQLAAQVKHVHFGLRDAWTDALTFPGRLFNVHPFRENPAALGPLAGLWVYGSNLNGRYRGRSHAMGGDCQHARPLTPDTERMTLAELLDLTSFWEWNGPRCSFCHGWSGQRLTPDQYTYYLTVRAGLSR